MRRHFRDDLGLEMTYGLHVPFSFSREFAQKHRSDYLGWFITDARTLSTVDFGCINSVGRGRQLFGELVAAWDESNQ